MRLGHKSLCPFNSKILLNHLSELFWPRSKSSIPPNLFLIPCKGLTNLFTLPKLRRQGRFLYRNIPSLKLLLTDQSVQILLTNPRLKPDLPQVLQHALATGHLWRESFVSTLRERSAAGGIVIAPRAFMILRRKKNIRIFATIRSASNNLNPYPAQELVASL